jgi:hypothetical protein
MFVTLMLQEFFSWSHREGGGGQHAWASFTVSILSDASIEKDIVCDKYILKFLNKL